jgi:hypothetical protein
MVVVADGGDSSDWIFFPTLCTKRVGCCAHQPSHTNFSCSIWSRPGSLPEVRRDMISDVVHYI